MDTTEIITGHNVQHDASGQGHAWRNIDASDIPANIAEEIACWIIEDEPDAGAEIVASNGLHYRTQP